MVAGPGFGATARKVLRKQYWVYQKEPPLTVRLFLSCVVCLLILRCPIERRFLSSDIYGNDLSGR
jgi:hypothetical protein